MFNCSEQGNLQTKRSHPPGSSLNTCQTLALTNMDRNDSYSECNFRRRSHVEFKASNKVSLKERIKEIGHELHIKIQKELHLPHSNDTNVLLKSYKTFLNFKIFLSCNIDN